MSFGFSTEPIYSGSVNSGKIASGSISWPNMASGAIQSGTLATTGAPDTTTYLRDDFSWTLPGYTSGTVGSGALASGSVQGFFGTIRNIASGTVGVFDLGSGAVVTGSVGSGAVVSGNIASGQVGNNSLGNGAAQSGDIASGRVSQFKLGSGAFNSGSISSGAVKGSIGAGARNIASGTVGAFDIGSGSVLSGAIASGQIGNRHLSTNAGAGAVQSGAIASGQVWQFKISSGAVNSGQVASGAVLGSLGGGAFNIASGTVGPNEFGSGSILSGAIASGQVGNFAISSGAITSGLLGVTGTPTGVKLFRSDFTWTSIEVIASGSVGSGAVLSGNIASGQIGTFHFASGDIITNTRSLIFDQYTTEETISGVRCAQVSRSGHVRIAMAAVSGRMPATGVVFTNVASGSVATVIRFGDVLGPSSEIGSGLCISGRMGRSLWVGASGQVVTLSGGGPTIGVGATNSGAWGQWVGTSSASGAILVDVVAAIPLLSGAANITTNMNQWPV